VFSEDGLYLLYVDRGCTVIAYSLSDLAPHYHVPDCPAHQLVALPTHHRLFLATCFHVDDSSSRHTAATVAVADLTSRHCWHTICNSPFKAVVAGPTMV